MATKTSILVFYLRLAKNTQKIMRMASWAVLGVVNVAGTILTIMNIFQCQPVSAAWDIRVKPDRCIPLLTEFICSAPVNVVTDLAILALPIPVLTGMRLPPRQKTILVMTFALGIFATIVDVVRIYYLQQALERAPASVPKEPTSLFGRTAALSWNTSLSFMWSAVEVNVSIICACVPTLKPLIIRILPAMIVDPDRTLRSSTQTASSNTTKPSSTDGRRPSMGAVPAGLPSTSAPQQPPVLSVTPADERLSEEISIRDFLSSAPLESSAFAHGPRPNLSNTPSLAVPGPRDSAAASSVYFGFVNMKRPKSMLKTSVAESFRYCAVVSILFFLWGFSYGLLNTLHNVLAVVADMTTVQTLGLTSIHFGGGYFAGPLLVGEWLLRHDEHHRSGRKRDRGDGAQPVGGFKATFIVGLLIYGTGTIMFWPGAVLAAYGGFMVSSFVVGFGLAVLETAANPFLVLCGPPEYADARLLLAQAVQAVGSVLSGLLATRVFFDRLESRPVDSTTLIDVQWTYLAITLLSVLLALFFYYMPLPEVTDAELAELAARLPADPKQKSIGRLSLRAWSLSLAVLSQWAYVSAQENMSLFFCQLLSAFAAPHTESAAANRPGYRPPGLALSLPNYLLVTHAAFAASRFLAALLAYLAARHPSARLLPAPRTVLAASVSLASLSALVAVVLPRPAANPNVIAVPVVLFFFFEGPVWSLVFSLGLRGQGRRTKRAAAWLTMGGCGPAVWPFVAYAILRRGGSVQTSSILVVVLMAVAGVFPAFLCAVPPARRLADLPPAAGEPEPEPEPEGEGGGGDGSGSGSRSGSGSGSQERGEAGEQAQGQQAPPWESQVLDTRLLHV